MANTKHSRTTQNVLGYLRENQNIELPYTDIQKALNLPTYSVSNAITYLIAKGIPVSRPMRGVALYQPSGVIRPAISLAKPIKVTSKLYEFVGNSKGRVIVKGEDDELYTLSPLFSE